MASMSSQPSLLRPIGDSDSFRGVRKPVGPGVGVKAGWVKKYL